jgi:hypothetical protein
MKPKKNYKALSDNLFELYDNTEAGLVDVNKAKALVKIASAIISNQRGKLISLQVSSQKERVVFYED